MMDTLRWCESKLALTGVRGGGRLKSNECSGWPSSSSSFCGSTTGSVIVSKNTGTPATAPKILSKMLLSSQLVNVGNKVDKRMCGKGNTPEGHHLGVLVCSRPPKGVLGYTDSGDALGERGRRLGGRDDAADQG